MKTGKVPHEILQRLLSKVPADPRVLVGPGIGIDAAVIEFGDRLLVAKTDPITFATDRIGWYAVHINANDIAAMGAEPRFFMATVLLPDQSTEARVEEVFDQILAACAELRVSLIGGHTEITNNLDRPIIVGCMLGEADEASLVTTSGARAGDDILITKGIAVEGTAILAREAHDALAANGFAPEFIHRAADYLIDPGISVVRDARVARGAANIHAMHDPTEGGLATGLMEVAEASGLGMEVDLEAVPILPESQEICRALQLDPLGLIASGSLILTLDQRDTPRVLDALRRHCTPAYRIGRMTPRDQGLTLLTKDGPRPFPRFPRDEIARFFDQEA